MTRLKIKHFFLYLLYVSSLLTCSLPAADAAPEALISYTLSPKRLEIGQSALLTITADKPLRYDPQKWLLALQQTQAKLKNPLTIALIPLSQTPKGAPLQCQFALTAEHLGIHYIFEAMLPIEGEQEEKKLPLPRVMLLAELPQIATTLKPKLLSPLEAKEVGPLWKPLVWPSLILALLLFTLYIAYLNFKPRRPSSQTKELVDWKRELQQLAADGLPQQGLHSLFCHRLSEIVWAFLAQTVNPKASQQTSQECLKALAGLLPPPFLADLATLFALTDKVKFGCYIPSNQECSKAQALAEQLLQNLVQNLVQN